MQRLTADLSAAPEGAGRVLFAIPPRGLVVKFEQRGARPDREYLLTREPEQPGAAFPLVIGAVRLTEVREEVARGILLWSEAAPQPGDRVVPPPRVTIFLAPASDLARHPEASATLADQALELALSREPRLRVIPLPGQPDPAELAKRLKAAGEIGLLLEPLLLPDPAGVTLAAKARSVLSGQTTSTYAQVLSPAPRAAYPSPLPPTPPKAGLSPPPEKEAIRIVPPAPAETEVPPPGFVITKKEAEPGEIVPAGEKPGPIRNEVTEALLAITAADLDGDGRPELVGISEAGVFAYRWTDRGFVQLTRYLEPERFVRYLHVDAADINGNGRDEIFVTAISSVPAGLEMRNGLRSFVLELHDRTLKSVATDLPYFLRIARVPAQDRALLLAQAMGTHQPFAGPILKMAWKGNRYAQEGTLPLPRKVAGLYDLAILEAGDQGPTSVASVNEKGHLLVRRGAEVTWEGKETLGEVSHAGFLQTPRVPRLTESLRAITQPRAEGLAERRNLSRRILAASPLFGRGKVEVITVANGVHHGLQIRLFG
ncbi:MAG: FG-GAP repeat domain-containing protein, partial [Candidatus Methylomirabilales bacterium]